MSAHEGSAWQVAMERIQKDALKANPKPIGGEAVRAELVALFRERDMLRKRAEEIDAEIDRIREMLK